jgi:exonuclease SbcC
MRLNKLTVKNFGPHELIMVDLRAPVVGLLGANGSGKSTLLQAIRFALTGELPDPLSTYIRGRGINAEEMIEAAKADGGANDYQPFVPAKGADVELEFSLNGQVGTIARRITKSGTTRVLTWAGEKPLEAAVKVDTAMADILGAEKTAIAEIVFPAQGSLDNMLSGLPKTREELFIKLLLLTHFAKVSDMADAKARIIRNEIQDLSAQRDQLNDIKDTALRQLQDIETEFTKLSSWAGELLTLRELQSLSQEVTRARAQISSLEDDNVGLNQRVHATLASLHSGPDGLALVLTSEQQLEGLLEATRSDLEMMTQMVASQQDARGKLQRKTALTEERDRLLTQTQALQAEITALENWKAAAGADGDVTSLRHRREKAVAQGLLEGRLAATTQELNMLTGRLEGGAKAVELAVSEAATAKETYTARTREFDLASIRVTAMAAACEHGAQECVLCDGAFTATPEKLKTSKAAMQEAQHHLALAHEAFQKTDGKLLQYRTEIAKLQAQQELAQRAEGEIRQQMTTEPAEDITHLNSLLTIAQSQAEKLMALTARDDVGNNQRRIADIETELRAFPAELFFDAIVLEGAQANVERSGAFIRSAGGVVNTLAQIRGSLSSNLTALGRYQQSLTVADAARVAKLEETTTRLKELMRTEGDSALRVVEARQDDYQRAEGQLLQARSQLEDINKRLKRLEEREAEDARRAKVADTLVQFKEAFARRGIPITYVQDRFEHLVDLANRNLEYLDANFVVQVDPKEFVSLNFLRNDDATGTIFGMQKLSGGQKVRLSIAFLLAVQQLIIPELGLLVLDEPSMHLNDEGVESLADLLSNLGMQLQSADAQIIVCDHNHRLDRAFGQTINLSR